MSSTPSATYTLRGHVIATDREIRGYAIEVDEGMNPPAAFNRLVAGKDVEPDELYSALDGEGRRVVGGSDHGLKHLEFILGRLRQCFPDEIDRVH